MEEKTTLTLRRSSVQMFPLMETYEQGTQSRTNFCRTHSLSLPTFQYWLSKYRKHQKENDEQGSKFLSLQVGTPGGFVVEINYPNGVQLRFASLVPASYLCQLVSQIQV